LSIPFQVPSEYLAQLLSGELVRYGGIIKSATTGQIVGHLKEAGNLGMVLSQLPSNPVSGMLDVAKLASSGYEVFQLREISKAIEVLQLTSSIGAVASVATLGVSVAGFAVVINKLNKIESKLDNVASQLQEIRAILDEMNINWEMLTLSKMRSASERLKHAEFASTPSRRYDFLKESNREFAKLRHYFFCLLTRLGPARNPALQSDQGVDLFSRYFASALGQLHSEFLLNDHGAYKSTLKSIHDQCIEIRGFEVVDAYRSRCDNRTPLDVNFDFGQVMSQVKNIKDIVDESATRIDGFSVEFDYLEANNIQPVDYVAELKSMEENLILIPHH